MRPTASLDTRCYQAALYLYPPAFRREFSREIVRVFNEARHESEVASPGGGLWAFRAWMIADLARTIVLQWIRTGWPFIVVISTLYPLVVASAVSILWRPTPYVSHGTSEADVIVLALLSAVVLVVIATTIILTLWFTRPLFYRRRT
jgi:hypothetical protein